MIPALGAGGPGFKPRNGPKLIAFVPERSKGLDSSSSVFVLVGSNPIECILLQPDGLMGCWGVGVLLVYPSEFTPLLLLLLEVQDHFASRLTGSEMDWSRLQWHEKVIGVFNHRLTRVTPSFLVN
jgi:hypothetical protein